MAKNITLAVDEDVLEKVRRVASDRNTTVNALVRDYLGRLALQQDRAANAREELIKLSQTSTWDPGSDRDWTREDIYDRPVFHRHEHPSVRGFSEPSGTDKAKKGD
ncbi:MAG: DUF6364 family protein [Hyphomicrobium sp.]